MRDGRDDIRPSMLLLFHAQDGGQFERIHLYGMAWLSVWCDCHARKARRDVLAYAAGDALAVMWCRRAPSQITVRAKQLGIRVQSYLELRTAALEMYQMRLHEARVRFASGKIYTRRSPYWKTGASPPRDSSRAAPGHAQQLGFQWAA